MNKNESSTLPSQISNKEFSRREVAINCRDLSGCTPLLIAAQYGHADLAAFLIMILSNFQHTLFIRTDKAQSQP